ncbi:MAG: 2-amino-4-hydroxy-6-hydroxymethyldihydropteridine diphosphokinase [Myxococcota bacterium]|jgi:2-amino-4-hydroxy-6-hydroxymethyldihydropteridine diphosphokinase|nr:2-amino-4-hydroxy-6-hydroxymethyldihydropteridine diphosphokinase [Myxococcota bacterium]
MGTTAFIALGSNLGDREARLRYAVHAIDALAGVAFARGSRIYETDPVGPGEQGAYLNAVIEVSAALAARELLAVLLEIERAAGRKRGEDEERWSARVLDLDLLLYGDERIDEPGLRVPHPRMHERGFVLEPLCDVAAERVHPDLAVRFDALAAQVRDPEAVRAIGTTPLRPR